MLSSWAQKFINTFTYLRPFREETEALLDQVLAPSNKCTEETISQVRALLEATLATLQQVGNQAEEAKRSLAAQYRQGNPHVDSPRCSSRPDPPSAADLIHADSPTGTRGDGGRLHGGQCSVDQEQPGGDPSKGVPPPMLLTGPVREGEHLAQNTRNRGSRDSSPGPTGSTEVPPCVPSRETILDQDAMRGVANLLGGRLGPRSSQHPM